MSDDPSKVDTNRPKKPKTGGRIKGTPNKNSLNLAQRLEELNFDVAAELVSSYHALPPMAKFDNLMRLLRYLHPVLKEVEAPKEELVDELAHESDENLLNLVKRP